MSKELTVEEVLEQLLYYPYAQFNDKDNHAAFDKALTAINRIRVQDRIDELSQMNESANLYSDSSSRSLVIRVWLPNRIAELQDQLTNPKGKEQ